MPTLTHKVVDSVSVTFMRLQDKYTGKTFTVEARTSDLTFISGHHWDADSYGVELWTAGECPPWRDDEREKVPTLTLTDAKQAYFDGTSVTVQARQDVTWLVIDDGCSLSRKTFVCDGDISADERWKSRVCTMSTFRPARSR